MAKQSGLGDRLFVHGVDISGDVGAVGSLSSKKALIDVTAIDASAMERIGGLGDGQISFSSYFNDGAAANRAAGAGSTMVVLSALPATDVLLMYLRGTTLGNPCACLSAKQVNYDGNRGADGALTFATDAQASAGYPLEWGIQVTPGKVTAASAQSETGVVEAAQTSAGGVGFLQFFSRASGTPTFLIEDSADTTNGIDGTWATLLTFVNTGGASAFAERLEVTGTVDKGLRATTTGVFTTAVFAIGFRRGTAEDVISLA